MPALSIRKIDPDLKERLRIQAARNGRSMEAEARSILRAALDQPEQQTGLDLFKQVRTRFGASDGFDIDLPPRSVGREPPDVVR